MKRLLILLVIISLLFTGNITSTLAQETSNGVIKEDYIILYDEAHYQYFTMDLMSTALASLNDSLDTDDLDITVHVYPHYDKFNSTNLQGSDLTIVSNPGTYENGTLYKVSSLDNEDNALLEYVNIGGSVLFMASSFSHNSNITGHAQALENLKFSALSAQLETPGGEVSTQDIDNTTVIIDEVNNLGNTSYVKLTSKNINLNAIRSEPNNLPSESDDYFVYYGAEMETIGEGQVIGNTSSYAYAVSQEYVINKYQQSPLWMFGEDFGDNKGRAILIGSTVMFSDYQYDSTTKWAELGQNLALFQNIVAWLLEITPIPVDQPIVTEPFEFFAQIDVIAAILFGIGVIILFFAYLIYKSRIQMNQIFKFRTDKKPTRKSKSKTAKPAPEKTTKSKPKKRRRRT